MKTRNFSYTRKDGSETLNDGEATRLAFGVHISMWGGENGYWFTTTGGQDGSFTAVLTSSIVDSTDVPVKKWQFNHPYGTTSLEATIGKVDEICREAAEIIGADCVNDDSVETLREILFEDQQL